jgi:23S rRNA G2445 N2-methylase RlmL
MSMNLIAGKKRILITCSKGIAPVLEKELVLLDFPVLSAMEAGVATEGTLADAMFLNLHLRTGHRVLFPVLEFAARDTDDLYRELSEVAWEECVDETGYICMTSSVDNPSVRDARYVNVRCKDAVVDRIRLKTGARPDSGPDRGGLVFFIHWKADEAAIFIDTSGLPLCRRGYRKIPLEAPMQETLAAAVVMSSGWTGEGNFINPMCGSGTLAIEAALIGLKRAPGLLRSNYSFMHLKGFDAGLWEGMRREARRGGGKGLRGRIIATDIRQQAVEAARRNAATAGVEHLIEFSVCDYSGTDVPGGGGTVIVNPEYGARMGKVKELENVYKGIGDFFKQKCGGYRGYIFTGNLELAKKVGLRSSKRTIFFNGEIECRLLEYELYEGSRKHAELEKTDAVNRRQ